jgi:REP element-mobilizing transposase RayT
MPRSLRIEYPGAYYHVMARGDREQSIFRDDVDRQFFLKALAEACGRTGWRIHAWVLMGNHYHLLLETPEANLVPGMQWLQNAYTRRFNVRHGLEGAVFGDRYKSAPVEGSNRYYYETLVDYIHLNPVRTKRIKSAAGQSVLDFPWSSIAGGYAMPPTQRPPWLAAADGLKAFGFADTAKGRRAFVTRLDRRALEERGQAGVPKRAEGTDGRTSNLQRGWYWGGQTFADELLAVGKQTLKRTRRRLHRASREKNAHDLRRAEELLEEGVRAAGLGRAEIARLPGTDARKVEIARAIWRTTTVSQGWLAEKLGMRSATHVSQQLRLGGRKSSKAKLPERLRQWLNRLTK